MGWIPIGGDIGGFVRHFPLLLGVLLAVIVAWPTYRRISLARAMSLLSPEDADEGPRHLLWQEYGLPATALGWPLLAGALVGYGWIGLATAGAAGAPLEGAWGAVTSGVGGAMAFTEAHPDPKRVRHSASSQRGCLSRMRGRQGERACRSRTPRGLQFLESTGARHYGSPCCRTGEYRTPPRALGRCPTAALNLYSINLIYKFTETASRRGLGRLPPCEEDPRPIDGDSNSTEHSLQNRPLRSGDR